MNIQDDGLFKAGLRFLLTGIGLLLFIIVLDFMGYQLVQTDKGVKTVVGPGICLFCASIGGVLLGLSFVKRTPRMADPAAMGFFEGSKRLWTFIGVAILVTGIIVGLVPNTVGERFTAAVAVSFLLIVTLAVSNWIMFKIPITSMIKERFLKFMLFVGAILVLSIATGLLGASLIQP